MDRNAFLRSMKKNWLLVRYQVVYSSRQETVISFPALILIVSMPENQVINSTCTRLSENVGACPILTNSAELILLTVPLFNCRQ